MKCSVCLHPLVRIGTKPKQYRDVNGRVYKTIHWPRYAPCPRKNDPEFHPAAARRATPPEPGRNR